MARDMVPVNASEWYQVVILALVSLVLSLGPAIYFRSHPVAVGTVLLMIALSLCLGGILWGRTDPEGMLIAALVFVLQMPIILFGTVGAYSLLHGLRHRKRVH
jgi:ABC-type transport system involved in cytochrome c biogenesis permease component